MGSQRIGHDLVTEQQQNRPMAVWCDEKNTYLCGLPPSNLKPQRNHQKNIKLILVQGHFIKHLTSTPQNCQGHQKQGKSEKLTVYR